MPFTLPERRAGALTGEFNDCGDLCCKHYTYLIRSWKQSPRWTTIDDFARRIWPDDEQRAAGLALLVGMFEFGYPYEQEKKKQNGPVE